MKPMMISKEPSNRSRDNVKPSLEEAKEQMDSYSWDKALNGHAMKWYEGKRDEEK